MELPDLGVRVRLKSATPSRSEVTPVISYISEVGFSVKSEIDFRIEKTHSKSSPSEAQLEMERILGRESIEELLGSFKKIPE